jgi:hypothetical protein
MSAALLEAPSPLFVSDGGRRPTLEEVLDGAWRAVRSHAEADCPVCRGAMSLADDGVARCAGCGTTLA